VVINKGDKVFVIGCGNTAIDAARTALRMGADEVTIVYHRAIENMAALRAEYDDAVAEGVKFLWNSSVVKVNPGEGKKLQSIVIEAEGEQQTVDATHLILAVGSQPAARIVSTTTGIDVDERGYVLTRENPYGMTTRRGVFAGGDVTNRPATVVHAMQDAKLVAEGIARYIDAVKLMDAIQ
jgi:glutamate synthase (NADPH/NADH) small chain